MPVHLEVLEVFPLQEGVLIKAEYNRDVLHFNPDEQHEPKYSYMTLTGHPLNDLKPLALRIPASQMVLDSELSDLVETDLELLKIFTKLPLAVSFSEKSGNVLSFNLVKKRPERAQTGAEYVRSLEKESRHQLLENICCEYEKFLLPIHQEKVLEKPSKFVLSRGPLDEYKVSIFVFFQLRQEVALYTWDFRLPSDQCIKKLKTFAKVVDVAQLYFTRSKENYEVKLAKQKPASDSMESSVEVRTLREKASALNKDVLLLEADQQTLQVH